MQGKQQRNRVLIAGRKKKKTLLQAYEFNGNYSVDDLNKVANPLEEARSTAILLHHYRPRTPWPNPSRYEHPSDSALARHLYKSNRDG